jgi:hypothetical protein
LGFRASGSEVVGQGHRGVAGERGARLAHAVERRKDPLFDLHVLEHGLDDDICSLHPRVVERLAGFRV